MIIKREGKNRKSVEEQEVVVGFGGGAPAEKKGGRCTYVVYRSCALLGVKRKSLLQQMQ